MKRVLTAAGLIAGLLAALYLAPVWLFGLLVLALTVAALSELYGLTAANDRFMRASAVIFGSVFAAVLIFWGHAGAAFSHRFSFCIFSVGAFFLLVLAYMAHYTAVEGVVARLGLVLFGTLYLAATLPAFVWMRAEANGRAAIILTVSAVAVGDTFAFAAGRLFGRRKLAPLISPKKTVEGLVASFFGGALAAVICRQLFLPEIGLASAVFLGAGLALIGALGDLIESLIKRGCHVKDSGTLLPGHGGILDRIDAYIFAAPFAYFVFYVLWRS